MENERILGLLKEIISIDKIKIDEPMSSHTTFKIGGPADFLVLPSDINEILNVYKLCQDNNVKLTTIGNGSNLVVRDGGIRGIVLKLYKNFSQISVNENIIEGQCGALLSKIANEALKNNLSGLEFASGIPGTLGGAVIMNAGAYGHEMHEVVLETKFIDHDSQIKTIKNNEHQFGYRKSIFQNKQCIILSTRMQLKEGNQKEIKDMMECLNSQRKSKQPLEMPSAGSVFRRPEGHFVGKLVDDCNLKGYSIGGAQVSEKHSGFIVNKGNATCTDVLDLIKHIKKTVKDNFGVELETEVKIIGEE